MLKRLTILAALVAAAPALAQDTDAVFAALDADKNGSITMAEAQRNPAVAASFTAADMNADGTLSKAEFDAAFR